MSCGKCTKAYLDGQSPYEGMVRKFADGLSPYSKMTGKIGDGNSPFRCMCMDFVFKVFENDDFFTFQDGSQYIFNLKNGTL